MRRIRSQDYDKTRSDCPSGIERSDVPHAWDLIVSYRNVNNFPEAGRDRL